MISSEFFEMLVVFSSIVLIVKTVADYKTKNNLIKNGLVDEKIKFLFANAQASSSLASVKWGLVFIGIGTALFAREWIDITDEGMFGIMFLFAGISFILFHLLAKSEAEKNNK